MNPSSVCYQDDHQSQSHWWLVTTFTKVLSNVLLNHSTMPSDCGWSIAFLVFWMPNGCKLLWKWQTQNFLLGCSAVLVLFHKSTELVFNKCFLIQDGITFGPLAEIVCGNQDVFSAIFGSRKWINNMYTFQRARLHYTVSWGLCFWSLVLWLMNTGHIDNTMLLYHYSCWPNNNVFWFSPASY